MWVMLEVYFVAQIAGWKSGEDGSVDKERMLRTRGTAPFKRPTEWGLRWDETTKLGSLQGTGHADDIVCRGHVNVFVDTMERIRVVFQTLR
ncbi:predicted protein [Histoplasma mississippiense (nom. inval.)]|uniref:predicted protein n=1 Tax=Ajellomyces capsulatus (strain NAm1 / WU24) TaxID=2059318 RepID=UPI000157C91E|nr:predicted protein [Histoplasma mississippiense (nom. inval.)]EDN08999.1 predicted protein [Histoplasma mississippiense (nom. inval.)]